MERMKTLEAKALRGVAARPPRATKVVQQQRADRGKRTHDEAFGAPNFFVFESTLAPLYRTADRAFLFHFDPANRTRQVARWRAQDASEGQPTKGDYKVKIRPKDRNADDPIMLVLRVLEGCRGNTTVANGTRRECTGTVDVLILSVP
jgi:hypothetical protein